MINNRIETPDQSSNMEQLAKWIRRMRFKKLNFYRRPQRNLRVQAVLTHALCKAENEFRSKQLKRISRWNKMKEDFSNSVEEHGSYGLYNVINKEEEQDNTKINPWQEPLCPELSSLDDFMLKVNQIKSPIQR